jgi:hypothetical protein
MAANPYVEARREWDERYADLVLGKRNWQLAAAGSLAVALILAAGIVWLATRSRYIPYIVEVDKLGYALTIPQPLTATVVPDVMARMERYEISTHCWRTHAAPLIAFSTPITTPMVSPITRSSWPRSKPLRSRSIRSCVSRITATRCAGPKPRAI